MISEREKQKLLPPAGGRHSSAAAAISFGRHGRRPGEGAAVRDLDQSPPFKPTRLQARASKRACPVSRTAGCRPAILPVSHRRRRCRELSERMQNFHLLSKSFLVVSLLLQLSWRLPQISNDWLLRQQGGREAQNNKAQTQPWRLPSGEFLSEFFLPSMPVSCTPVGYPAALAIPPVIFNTARPQERRLEGVDLSRLHPPPSRHANATLMNNPPAWRRGPGGSGTGLNRRLL